MLNAVKHRYRNSKIDYYRGSDASAALSMTFYWTLYYADICRPRKS